MLYFNKRVCTTASSSLRKLVIIQVTLHTLFTKGVTHYSLKSPSSYRCNADSPKVLRLDYNVYFG